MNIGLFFGSFNPIHIGHTAIANYILEYSDLYEVWFVVSPQNPFKQDVKLVDESLRLEMTRLAIANEPRFKVSDVEFNLPKPSYTINTLERLNQQYPLNNFVLLMGSDNYLQINKWKDVEKIKKNFNFIIYPRPGYSVSEYELSLKVKIIDAPLLNISSTMIRNGFAEGKKLNFFLSPAVFDFILERKIF